MNSLLRPVGPEPARVYWVRRLLVLAALVVAATLVWTLVAGGDGARSDAKGGPSASASPQEAAAGSAAPCAAENLEITVQADRQSYPSGAEPGFTVKVTNTGGSGCTVDVGDASRELLVTSGKDRIWSSSDCAEGEGASRNLLLGAGKSDTQQVTWERVRSDEKCSEGLPAPRPGTYKAQVRLNGATSAQAVFVLE